MDTTTQIRQGDAVMTDWATHSPSGKRHSGIVLMLSPDNSILVVSWNQRHDGVTIPRLIAASKCYRIRDEAA